MIEEMNGITCEELRYYAQVLKDSGYELHTKGIPYDSFEQQLNKLIYNGFRVVYLPKISLWEAEVLLRNSSKVVILSTRMSQIRGKDFNTLSFSYKNNLDIVKHLRCQNLTYEQIHKVLSIL